MIYTENATMNGKQYKRTYSDIGYIEREGVMYLEAIDPIGTSRNYTKSIEFTQEELEEKNKLQIIKEGINAVALSNDVSLRMKSYYPTWRELVDTQFTAETEGFKFTYGDDLYKTIHPKQEFLSNWVPGQGTESIFERIDETHTGTKDDPIPYKVNMTVYIDKFYTEDGILYRCIRNSGQALHNKASELVGHYFEVADE